MSTKKVRKDIPLVWDTISQAQLDQTTQYDQQKSIFDNLLDQEQGLDIEFISEDNKTDSTNIKILVSNDIEDWLLPVLSSGAFFKRNDPYIIFNKIKLKSDSNEYQKILDKMTRNRDAVAIITDTDVLDLTGYSSYDSWKEKHGNDVKLKLNLLKNRKLLLNDSTIKMLPIHPDFLFSWQKALDINHGTCFFISKNEVAMAAHTYRKRIEQSSNKTFIIIKGFYMEDKSKLRTIEKSDIFEIVMPRKVLGEEEGKQDWAIMEVKPLVSGTTPSYVEPSKKRVTCGADTYCLGHGANLPMKISLHGMVFFPTCAENDIKSERPPFFKCKLETFSGNSGSPVFDALTHEVVGIVSESTQVYVSIPKNKPKYTMPIVHLGGTYGANCTHVEYLTSNWPI